MRVTIFEPIRQFFHRLLTVVRAQLSKISRFPAARKIIGAIWSVTPLGWFFLIFGTACFVLGLIGRWQEFVLIGFSLVSLFVLAVLWTLGRSAYRAELELDRPRIRLGDSALGRVVLTSKTKRHILPARIELPVGARVAAFTVPPLVEGKMHEELFSIPGRRRSIVKVGPVLSVRSDPFGLIRRTRSWTDKKTLYIHPPTVLLDGTHPGFLKDIEGIASKALSQSDMAFHALREYVPGDDRRAVHWRTTARVGKLMVRQFEETHRSHLLIILNLDKNAYNSEEEFELAVSCAASLALLAMGDDREVSLISDRGIEKAKSPVPLLDSLSGISQTDRPKSVVGLATQAWKEVPEASVALLITGMKTDISSLRVARLRLSEDVPVCAIRCGSHNLERKKIGSLLLLDLPDLEVLRRSLRGWE